MKLADAIYKRRSVRTYTQQQVQREEVLALIDAAVQAPSAMNQQAWAFAVIQDRHVLMSWSERIRRDLLAHSDHFKMSDEVKAMIAEPGFCVFYDAGTLILIGTRFPERTQLAEVDASCAAQNLMLAAYDRDIATCPIGFAVPWLNQPSVKMEIGLPSDYRVVLPVIAGYQRAPQPPVVRRPAEILMWQR